MAAVVAFPLRLVSTLNVRDHWTRRAARARHQRETTGWALKSIPKPELPCVIRMVRIAPRELDDDNLAGAFKSVRDAVAEWLGVDDRDKRVRFVCEQRRGVPKEYGVRISFEAMEVAV